MTSSTVAVVYQGDTYQGFKVIQRDQAKTRHPLHGMKKLIPLEGASLLALANDNTTTEADVRDHTFVVVCNYSGCRYNGITKNLPYVAPKGDYKPIMDQAASVNSHIGSAHLAVPRGPLYSDNQIRVAIAIYLKWQATQRANWLLSAAQELDREGHHPLRADHWSPSMLSGVARRYMIKPKFRNVKAATTPLEPLATDDAVRSAVEQNLVGAKSTRPNSVARNVRIKTSDGKVPYTHNPVDFSQIIEQQESDRVAALASAEKEAEVPAGADPVLTFSETLPTKTLSLGEPIVAHTDEPVVIPAQQPRLLYTQQAPQHPVLVVPPVDKLEVVSAYEHVGEIKGNPVFRYDGKLMVGRIIEDFII